MRPLPDPAERDYWNSYCIDDLREQLKIIPGLHAIAINGINQYLPRAARLDLGSPLLRRVPG